VAQLCSSCKLLGQVHVLLLLGSRWAVAAVLPSGRKSSRCNSGSRGSRGSSLVALPLCKAACWTIMALACRVSAAVVLLGHWEVVQGCSLTCGIS